MTHHDDLPDELAGLDANIVIAASAGTGKTHALTSIYIGHALGLGASGREVPVERIVATTFSRAAAGEIRERLELRFGRIAREGIAALDAGLIARALSRGHDDAELRRRAARCLDGLPRASIDTLHGVAAELLRHHGLDVGIAPDFAILEEQQAFDDASRSVDDVLAADLEAGGDWAEIAQRLIDACGGLERTRSDVAGLLGRMDDEGLGPEGLTPADDEAAIERLVAEVQTICDEIATDEPSELTDPARALLGLYAACRADTREYRDAVGTLLGVRASARVKRLTAWPRLDELRAALGSSSASKGASIAAFTGLLAHRSQIATDARGFAAIVTRVGQRLHAARRSSQAFAFGDLLRLARDMLRDHPELARRAGSHIDVLLVDEFQDTSRVQRDLILLLCEDPAARALRTPGTLATPADLKPAGLAIVGDRKQSIYGFRGADVSVFTSLTAELAGERAAAALDLRGMAFSDAPIARFASLTENRRSLRAILDAVNAIAERDFSTAPRQAYEIRYTEAERLRVPTGQSGEASRAGTGAQPDAPGRVTIVLDDGALPDDAPPIVAAAERQLRAAFIAAGAVSRAHRAGAAWQDVAVIARRRSTLPLVELALGRLSVPFVVAGRALYRTPEVTDLFAALRLAVDPFDRHALAIVARGPLGGLSDATLAALSEPGRGLMAAGRWSEVIIADPGEAVVASRLAGRLDEWVSIARRLSPRDAVAFAVRHFELEPFYAALPHGPVRFGNVGRLLEIAARHGGSLPAFVRWLARQIELDMDEAEAAVFSNEDDAVRLLTIHASKGLAFPHVVLLDLDSTERAQYRTLSLSARDAEHQPTELVVRHKGPDGSVWTPSLRRSSDDLVRRARAERQRLSYVALTRAARELTLVMPPTPPRDSLGETIAALHAEGVLADLGVVAESAVGFLAETANDPASVERTAAAPPARPRDVGATALAVGATALADFSGCARRFRLIHVEGITEPELGFASLVDTEDDPRSLGSAAHRVLERWPLDAWGTPVAVEGVRAALEREGLSAGAEATAETAQGIARFLSSRYAARVRSAPRVEREIAWVTPLTEASRSVAAAPRPRRRRAPPPEQLDLFATTESRPAPPRLGPLLLKTTFDLMVVHADGSVDVIDYKRTLGGDVDRYRFQLAAYAVAARRALHTDRVRTGLVHLLADDPEPEWVEHSDDREPARAIAALAVARWRDEWPSVDKARCQRLRCNFIHACHPTRDR